MNIFDVLARIAVICQDRNWSFGQFLHNFRMWCSANSIPMLTTDDTAIYQHLQNFSEEL